MAASERLRRTIYQVSRRHTSFLILYTNPHGGTLRQNYIPILFIIYYTLTKYLLPLSESLNTTNPHNGNNDAILFIKYQLPILSAAICHLVSFLGPSPTSCFWDWGRGLSPPGSKIERCLTCTPFFLILGPVALPLVDYGRPVSTNTFLWPLSP